MAPISTFRLLRPSSFSCCANSIFGFSYSSSLLSTPSARLNSRRLPLFVLSYSGRRGRRTIGGRGRGRGGYQPKRGNSTLREEKRRDKAPALWTAPEMEEKEGVAGFNRKRAEGGDKSDRPRNLQLKTRKLNPINTISYIQILGTGMDTQDTSPSVFLFFDKQRFIFNAGEGLQRFCTEHKIKLSKVDHVFLTRVSSETAGGLPGLLLTLAGIGEEGMSVNIWGPSDLKYLVDAMRSFIPNAAMVHTRSFGDMENVNGASVLGPDRGFPVDPIVLIDDEVVRLSAILLKPRSFTSSRMKPGDVAVVYICELPEIKGKFDPKKATSLGLKPGPKYRELQLGNSVMSDSLNIMVHPSDVLGPSITGPIVLLVDCPTSLHIPELLSALSLECYYVDASNCQREAGKSVNCVIHLGPASVTKNEEYQMWMKKFGNVQHIKAGHEMKNIEVPILKSSDRISSRLNYLCPQLFPAAGLRYLRDVGSSSTIGTTDSSEVQSSDLLNIVLAENLLKFHLRPYSQMGLDRSSIPKLLNRIEIIKELLSEIPEVDDLSKQIRRFWTSHAENKDFRATGFDNGDVVEEPWMKKCSYLSNDNLRKQEENRAEEKSLYRNFSLESRICQVSDIPACLDNVRRDDMEIVFLGTGSSQPSKYRNVSSILVNLFSKGTFLLDCGEGTLAQLKRRFGIEGADNVVKSLKFIWISHIHADHHTGLARILALRCQLLRDIPRETHDPLVVVGPRPLKGFLDAYSRLEDLDVLFLDCRHTMEASWEFLSSHGSSVDFSTEEADGKENASGADKHPLETSIFSWGSKMQSWFKRPGSPIDTATSLPILRRLKELLHEAGLEALYSVPVVHCPQAFAFVLKAAQRTNRLGKNIKGWKLVYSGDTRPCQSLIDASSDATILIHEATFEDSLGEEAVARNHSTTMEAIQVGSKANAYRIILTHFSQRYPKIPVFDESHMNDTCVAFDLMSINLADLPLLPKALPYLKFLFRNEMVSDEPEEAFDSAVGHY
ncbi:ribonuclease Z [Apostasia shenzhenica]|uniref:ribonuclease Z n=1 Tax=Apostasia shenzhenica TaxID=1088818 RepID=A0A2I0AU24_9ASPA|nr:ribonuclease Z [Apostasia shenzhenica]